MPEVNTGGRGAIATGNPCAGVWIIDLQPILRSGLKSQLEASNFRILAEGNCLREALTQEKPGESPDLVILDLDAGLQTIAELKRLHPQTNVIVMGCHAEIQTLSQAFAAGADGYLLKSISSKALVESCKLAVLGEKVFPSLVTNFLGSLQSRVQVTDPHHICVGDIELSEREMGIVRGLAAGQTNKLIAKFLSITEATVKVHLKSVLRKLGASNRTQVAIWAIQNHLKPNEGAALGRVLNGHFDGKNTLQ
ncbi:MAG: response regulator transcription factor [Micropepsaceae bacterium]